MMRISPWFMALAIIVAASSVSAQTMDAPVVLQGHTGGVWGVGILPKGGGVVTGGGDGTMRLWDIKTGRPLKYMRGHGDTVLDIDILPDGRLVASASRDKTVRIWNVSTGRAFATLGSKRMMVTVAFTADGRRVLSAGFWANANVWDVASKRLITVASDRPES